MSFGRSTLRRFRRSRGSRWTAAVKSLWSAQAKAHQGRTPTAVPPTFASGIPRWQCPPMSTTECFLSECTVSSAGRTSLPPDGL